MTHTHHQALKALKDALSQFPYEYEDMDIKGALEDVISDGQHGLNEMETAGQYVGAMIADMKSKQANEEAGL